MPHRRGKRSSIGTLEARTTEGGRELARATPEAITTEGGFYGRK
jgi:hypothetical protein